MYSRKDLTEAILQMPIESTELPENDINNLLKILQYMYDYAKRLYVEIVPASRRNNSILLPLIAKSPLYEDENAIGLKMMLNNDFNIDGGDPYFIVMYSAAKYLDSNYENISLVRFSGIVYTFFENYKKGKCFGIVVNPQSEAELWLSPDLILKALHYKED